MFFDDESDDNAVRDEAMNQAFRAADIQAALDSDDGLSL